MESVFIDKGRFVMGGNDKLTNLIDWLKCEKYLIDEQSTTMTVDFEKEHGYELSKNITINETIKKIEEIMSGDFNMRIDKTNYYLNIAETVAQRGTCLRRNYGAIIVKNDEIISTGYTGSARGLKNCCDIGTCRRKELNVPSGERYELCRSVHAEQNAIISASRKDMIGSTLYLVGKTVNSEHYVKDAKPCDLCERFILNAGIAKVIVRINETDFYILNNL